MLAVLALGEAFVDSFIMNIGVERFFQQYRYVAIACEGNVSFVQLLKNSVALVRKRTIPTERPPPVGEVSANFCG